MLIYCTLLSTNSLSFIHVNLSLFKSIIKLVYTLLRQQPISVYLYCTQTQSRTRSCRGNTGSSPALITLIIINSIQYSVPSSLQQYTIIIIIFTIISLYRHYHYQQRHHHPYNHWHHHERQHHHYCIHCQHLKHHHHYTIFTVINFSSNITRLGIPSSVLIWANELMWKNEWMSDLPQKMSDSLICSFLVSHSLTSLIFGEQPERVAHNAHFWWSAWAIFSHH